MSESKKEDRKPLQPIDEIRTIDVEKALASTKKEPYVPSPGVEALRAYFSGLLRKLRNLLLMMAAVATCAYGFGHFVCNPILLHESDSREPRIRDARPGDTTTVTSGYGGGVAVGPKKWDFDRLTQLSAASDYTGIDQMIAAGKILKVADGTRVRIIQRTLSGYEIRIEDGVFEGQSAWVVDNYVARIEN